MTQTKAELLQTRHQGDLKLGDADSTHYVGFKAPASVTSNLVWTLPAVDGSANQFLKTNASGVLSWGTVDTSTLMPLSGGIFTGDVTFDGATAGRDIVFDRSDNALEFANNAKAIFGASSELQLYYDGNNSYIEHTNHGETLILKADYIHLVEHQSGDNQLRCRQGFVELYDNGTKRFETVNGGVAITGTATVSGNLTVSGTTTTVDSVTLSVKDKNIDLGVVSSPSDTTADGGGLTLKGATDKTFNWVDSTDAWTSSEHIHLLDNKKLIVGTGGSDLTLSHDGTNSLIDNNTGNLNIQSGGTIYLTNAAGNEVYAQFSENGAVSLRYDNTTLLTTTSSGVKIPDSFALELGDRSSGGVQGDLRLYHDGSNSYIDEIGSGNLYIRNNTDNAIFCETNSTVKLYYDGSEKLATSSTGVTVTGTVTATSFSGSGANLTSLPATSPAGSNTQIQFNNSGSFGAVNTLIYSSNLLQSHYGFQDQHGFLRDVPSVSISNNTTVNSGYRGRCCLASNNFYVGTAAAGYVVSVINVGGSDITINRSTTHLYNTGSGDNNSSYTLASRGMITLFWSASSTVYMSGSGIS